MPTLENVVVQSAGKPVPNALVIWWDQGGRSDARITDGGGFVNFGKLVSGSITLSIEANGFNDLFLYKTDDNPTMLAEVTASQLPFDQEDQIGPLHTEGRGFKDANAKEWHYRGCSEFGLFKNFVQGGFVAIDKVVTERLSIFGPGMVFRTFRYAGNNNTFALAPDWSPTRLDKALDLTRYLAARGCRIDFTAGDAQLVLPGEAEQQAEVNSFYEAIEGESNAFFQTCNEAFKNGINVQRVKPPKGRVLRSSGYYEIGPDSAFGNPWGEKTLGGTMLDFLDYHSIRDGLNTPYPKAIWDPVEDMYSFVEVPIVDEEPFGFNDNLVPGRRSNNPRDGFRLACERRLWEVGVNFHSDCGIDFQPFTPKVRECATSFIKGWQVGGGR